VNPDWLVPQWPAPAHVRAVCTTRAGGTSAAPYDALNLGDHVGDRPVDVAANRAILAQVTGARPVFLSQVHGAHAVSLSSQTAQGTQADGCITAQPRLACTILVADCLPVLLTNDQGSLVAAAHAGWRGLAGAGETGQGILEAVLACFSAPDIVDKAQDASKTIAWLGPCIGAPAFEVGDDVRDAFLAHDRAAGSLFTPKTGDPTGAKWLADLQGLARLRLAALGVTQIYGNDGTRAWCTVSNPSRFFSYRRDRVSGRMAACIWLD
jgi:hypothetical protein